RAQDARRGQERRPQGREPQGARRWHGQPRPPRRERAEIRHRAGGLDQSLQRRHRRRDRAGKGRVQEARRRSLDGPPLARGREALWRDLWAGGGKGPAAVGGAVLKVVDSGKSKLKLLYPDDMPLIEKIRTIAREIYRAKDIDVHKPVRDQLESFEKMGYGKL